MDALISLSDTETYCAISKWFSLQKQNWKIERFYHAYKLVLTTSKVSHCLTSTEIPGGLVTREWQRTTDCWTKFSQAHGLLLSNESNERCSCKTKEGGLPGLFSEPCCGERRPEWNFRGALADWGTRGWLRRTAIGGPGGPWVQAWTSNNPKMLRICHRKKCPLCLSQGLNCPQNMF